MGAGDFGALRARLHAEVVDWDAVWGMVRRWPDEVALAEVVVPYVRGHLPRVPPEAYTRWEAPASWLMRMAQGDAPPAMALCESASVWWEDLPALTAAGVVLPALRSLYVLGGVPAEVRCDVRDLWSLAPGLEVLGLYGGTFDRADRAALELPGAPETLRVLVVYAGGVVGDDSDGLASAAWIGQLEVLDLGSDEDVKSLADDRMLVRLSEGGRLRELSLWEGLRDERAAALVAAWDAPPSLRSVCMSAWFGGFEGFALQLSRARWWPQIERAELELQNMTPAEAHALLRLDGAPGVPWRELWFFGVDAALVEVLTHERLRSVEQLSVTGAQLAELWHTLASDPSPRALVDLHISGAHSRLNSPLSPLPFAGQLRALNLSGGTLNPPGTLARAFDGMCALETLILSHTGLADASLREMSLEKLPALQTLDVEEGRISSAGVAWMLDHPALPALHTLRIHQRYVPDFGSHAHEVWRGLAEGRLVAQLAHLTVNVIGDDDPALIDEALGRLVGGVRTLKIGVRHLSVALAEALARAPFAQLDHFTLDVAQHNEIAPGALAVLCEAPWIAHLSQLILSSLYREIPEKRAIRQQLATQRLRVV